MVAPHSAEALSMDDLGDVYSKLHDARNTWFNIGLALKINYSTLESVESEKPNNSDRLRRMLAHRIQSGGPLTWTDLSDCLRHSTVERRDLADEICQGLIKVVLAECLNSGCYCF